MHHARRIRAITSHSSLAKQPLMKMHTCCFFTLHLNSLHPIITSRNIKTRIELVAQDTKLALLITPRLQHMRQLKKTFGLQSNHYRTIFRLVNVRMPPSSIAILICPIPVIYTACFIITQINKSKITLTECSEPFPVRRHVVRSIGVENPLYFLTQLDQLCLPLRLQSSCSFVSISVIRIRVLVILQAEYMVIT